MVLLGAERGQDAEEEGARRHEDEEEGEDQAAQVLPGQAAAPEEEEVVPRPLPVVRDQVRVLHRFRVVFEHRVRGLDVEPHQLVPPVVLLLERRRQVLGKGLCRFCGSCFVPSCGLPSLLRAFSPSMSRLATAAGLLESYSFERVLERGFVLVRDKAGDPVTSVAATTAGMALDLRFHDGAAAATVDGAPVPRRRAAPKTPDEGEQGSLL